MRIVHVSTQDTWGGGEKQIYYLMNELSKKHVHQVLACPAKSPLAKKAKHAGFSVVELKKSSFAGLSWGLELRKILQKEGPSILHAHDGRAHNCVLMCSLLSPGTPVVVHRRIVKSPFGFYHRWKFNHPSIRKIICISSAVQKNLENIVHDKSKLMLIPSGIHFEQKNSTSKSREHSKTHIAHLPENSQSVLNIGSLLPQKQQIFFLKIAKKFLEKHPEKKGHLFFAILGDGPLHKDLESFIHAHQLETSCLLLGFSNRAQELLEAADLLICTSVDEALGNVVLEAFLAGVPVIASNSGGFPDLVKDGQTGLLPEALNEDAFLKACERILHDKEFSAKLKSGALLKVREFDIEKTADSMYKIYQSIQDHH